MAKQHTTLAPGLVEKLKNASSLDAMKKIYRNMNPAEREAAAGVFVREAKKKPAKSPAPKTQQTPKQTKTSAKTTETAKQRQARILKEKPATGPMKLAAEAKKARILKDKPATGPMKLAAESKKAKKAIEEYEKKKNKRNRSTMPYAGKFPGEPDKNDKRSKFPKFFK